MECASNDYSENTGCVNPGPFFVAKINLEVRNEKKTLGKSIFTTPSSCNGRLPYKLW